jgi:hypothetical protein
MSIRGGILPKVSRTLLSLRLPPIATLPRDEKEADEKEIDEKEADEKKVGKKKFDKKANFLQVKYTLETIVQSCRC